jgi:long-chain acyl-CoA synthetase
MNPLLSLRKLGSCGIARPDTDLLIVDMETGLDVMKAGEPGEIIIRGPMVIREYWHKPHETEKTIKNGWLYTGDIGSLDKDGYLYLHDRRVDVINCSGFKVYPREVEEVLYAMPQIFKVCVVGVPDPKRGKTVKAFIQTKPGQSLTFQEVVDWCKKSLSHYKLPTIVQFIDPMPVTSMGKINRRGLLGINV